MRKSLISQAVADVSKLKLPKGSSAPGCDSLSTDTHKNKMKGAEDCYAMLGHDHQGVDAEALKLEKEEKRIAVAAAEVTEKRISQERMDVDHMRKVNEKDRVAFLLYRAPVTSWPSQRLRDLENSQPIELTRMLPMNRTFYCWANHDQVELDTRFNRKRDRVTEYTEHLLLQANIIRKV